MSDVARFVGQKFAHSYFEKNIWRPVPTAVFANRSTVKDPDGYCEGSSGTDT
jgi:hypothetical protein